MTRWRREAIITIMAYVVIGLAAAEVTPGNPFLYHALFMASGVLGLSAVLSCNARLGKLASAFFVAAGVVRGLGFFLGAVGAGGTPLDLGEQIAAAAAWWLLAYEVGSVWVRVIVPGIIREKALRRG